MDLIEQNIALFRVINDLGKQYTALNPVFVIIAEYTVYLLLLYVLFQWFSRIHSNRMMMISGGISFIIGEIMGKIAGQFYFNYQPFAVLADVNQLIEKGVNNSFPSDHTILFFTFCVTFFLFRKKFRLFWVLLALFVAISRIGVGVHYPLDVLVGMLIGTTSAYACYKLVPNLRLTTWSLRFYENRENELLSIFTNRSKNKKKKSL
ncbi:undecaprenyl-diphosphatase [Brevibacillus daliensis]|uniref:undecaprenyl-diphosphatase n=1 Tax=Brevibacillus daliensis TaxID=2892995 RepID=UPI001E2C9064|nr:undecaprenyl-diphosphatase [Brevibacillus daliensis]